MRTKIVLAAAAFAASSLSAQAGGLLDANEEPTPTPVIVADGNQGSMGGALPWILGGLVIAGAVAASSSGS